MRVTERDTTTKVHQFLVPERFMKPFADGERRWVPADEHRIEVDAIDTQRVGDAVRHLMGEVAANPDYWGDYRIVFVHEVSTRQVVRR